MSVRVIPPPLESSPLASQSPLATSSPMKLHRLGKRGQTHHSSGHSRGLSEAPINPLLAAGLQYSDSLYVGVLLLVAVPATVLWSFFCFTGNAQTYKYLCRALTSTVLHFYLTVALMVGAGIDAVVGVTITALVISVVGYYCFVQPENVAFPSMAMWTVLLLVYGTASLINALTPNATGALGFVLRITDTRGLQFVTYNLVMLLICLAVAFVIDWCSRQTTWPKLRNVCDKTLFDFNFQTSFLSAWIVTSGVCYLLFCTGLSATTSLDPVNIFTFPSLFRWSHWLDLCLLAVWVALTIAGCYVQNTRDNWNNLEKNKLYK